MTAGVSRNGEDGLAAATPKPYGEIVAVQGEVDHLTRLTDQLLRLARAGAGALEPAQEAVGVADFLDGTGTRWEPVAGRRNVRREVGAPDSGYVEGDPALLCRGTDSLVDNAIRYKGEGAVVALLGYASNGGWNVDVAELGLALSAAIAHAHGGSLELVESEEPVAAFRLHQPGRVAA